MATNDTVMALAPLLDRPPWQRRVKGGYEKFIDNKWQSIQPADRLRLAAQDAQVSRVLQYFKLNFNLLFGFGFDCTSP